MMAVYQRITDSMFLDGPGLFKKYSCPQCEHILKDAVQPSCGHWLCQSCADNVFENAKSGSSPRCPRSDCGEELETQDGAKYFPDRFVRKEILNFSVRCVNYAEGCSWTGKISFLEDSSMHTSQRCDDDSSDSHVESCGYEVKKCPMCSTQVVVAAMENHMAMCPKATRQCPLYGLGCQHDAKMDSNDLEAHIKEEGLVQHIAYLATAIKNASGGVHGDGEDSGLAEDSAQGYSLGYSSETHSQENVPQPTRRIKSRGPAPKVEPDGLGNDIDAFVTDMITTQVSSLRSELESTLTSEGKRKDSEISQLKLQLSNFEKKVQAKETESEDRGFRLSLLENVSYDGTMIWKIPQFAQRMVDAQSGKYTSIFSLPFYTSRYGYKLCLRLYILGDGIGKGTHMSLFFVVMRGEFDNILQWPFTYKVTFRLLNQSGGQDIVDSFLPDPMSSSFKKPKTDMNVASGCPRFVSLSDVKSGGFISDDTIFVKVKVDTSAMKLP